MSEYQSYLRDCKCEREGIILHEGKAVCRWCRTPYAKGGCLFYEPEHFKKHKPEWEILSFKDKIRPFVLPVSEIPSCYKIEDYTKSNSSFTIHSVKRLSDGEEFCVGQICESTSVKGYVYKPIKRFFIKDNLMYVQLDEGYGNNDGCITINSIKKHIPKALFTTEDGVEITNGDKFYFVHDDFKSPIENFACAGFFNRQGTKFFSTKKAAEEYILLNKPIQVSYKEILEVFTRRKRWPDEVIGRDVKDFFQSKINP